jgi:hypothetical protein
MAMTADEREERVQKVTHYAACMFQRRNLPFNEIEFVIELGHFVKRVQGIHYVVCFYSLAFLLPSVQMQPLRRTPLKHS